MKKSIIITVLLSVLCFNSCGTKIEGPLEETVIKQDENESIELEVTQTPEETERGTEQIIKSNILHNYGETAIQGNRIYYLEGFTLYSMNINGSDHQQLSSDNIRWFHVLSDQIYYVNWPDDIIYVMNIDGSQVKKLYDEAIGDIHIVNDKIYYSNPVDNDGIYSINMDGSNKTKWSDSSIGYFEMMDNRIYYFDSSSSNKGIYSEKIDGSDTFKLTDDLASIIYLVDNWIYYLNEEDGNKLYAIQIDGSGKYKVTDDYALDISVAGDRIYYNDGREQKMYSINKDGSDRRRLLDHTVNWFIPGDDELYYSISVFYIYSMNLDGSNQLVIKDLMSETFKDVSYEITKSIHENMPEYRFVAKGMKRNTEDEWVMGFAMGLEVYDDQGMVLVNADFSYPSDDWIMGNHVYNGMMDTMGLHVSDVNFDGYKDVIILDSFSGAHSNTWYQCWLWNPETSTFVESLSFKEICNPALDSAKKYIYSSGGSGAGNRGWDIYQFIEGEFVVTNRLTYNESTDGFRFTESKLVNNKMEILRDDFIQADNFNDAVSVAGYIKDELWQLDHPRWYGVGGHEADQWLE